jgi:hypothetical protein
VTSPFSAAHPSLLVRAAGAGGGLAGVPGQTCSTALPLAGANLALPWSISFAAAFSGALPTVGHSRRCMIMLGDEDGAFIFVDLYVGSTYASNHKVSISLADDLGDGSSAAVPLAVGTRCQITLTWDGTRQRVLVDGAEVASAVVRNPGTITLKDVSLFILGSEGAGGAAGWNIFDLQYRLTG